METVSVWEFTVFTLLTGTCRRRRRNPDIYEREKVFMETVRSAGCAVGEYIGNGQGESETVTQATDLDFDADPGADADPGVADDNDGSNCDVNMEPLWIFYDCETTGLSIQGTHNRYSCQGGSLACATDYSNFLQSGEDFTINPISWYDD